MRELICDCPVFPSLTDLFEYMLGFPEHSTNQVPNKAVEIIFITNKHNIVGCFVSWNNIFIMKFWQSINHIRFIENIGSSGGHMFSQITNTLFYQWPGGFDPFREWIWFYFFMSSPLSSIILKKIVCRHTAGKHLQAQEMFIVVCQGGMA